VDEKGEHDAQQSQERRGSGLLRIFWALVVVLVLYVLTTGPVIKICVERRGPSATVNIFYRPLELANRHVPAAERFFDWYFKMWHILHVVPNEIELLM